MARGTFNTLGGAYASDPVSENHRRHLERQRREAYDARVTAFIGRELAGGSFRSLEALTKAACNAAVAVRGRALTEEQHHALGRCCRVIWGGVALRADLGRGYQHRGGICSIDGPSHRQVA